MHLHSVFCFNQNFRTSTCKADTRKKTERIRPTKDGRTAGMASCGTYRIGAVDYFQSHGSVICQRELPSGKATGFDHVIAGSNPAFTSMDNTNIEADCFLQSAFIYKERRILMKCPYIQKQIYIEETTQEFDDNQCCTEIVTKRVEDIELPDCLEENCGAWQSGSCNFKGNV